MKAVITSDTSPEEAEKLKADYLKSRDAGYECELINEVEGYRLYCKDGKENEKQSRLYGNLLRYAIFTNNARDIWSKIDELIQYKEKPREICLPIRAAIDADVIERPEYHTFIKDFGQFYGKISKSQFDNLLNPNNDRLTLIKSYNIYKEMFRRMKKK